MCLGWSHRDKTFILCGVSFHYVLQGIEVHPSEDEKVITLVTQIKMWPILLLDYSKGFGGKYGVQTDRVDKVRNKCTLY